MVSTILIADDSDETRDRIEAILNNSGDDYRVLSAGNGLDAFTLLVSKQVDLVLCDIVMPVLDGLKFLALKGTRPDLIDIPVIMITVVEDVDQRVKALEAGAADCLTKPCHEAELLARVRVHLTSRLYQRELREKNSELEQLSKTDSLTHLANRRHFLALAEVELLRAAQEGTPLALVMSDIDHFKHINDEYGHLVGDEVIRRFADALRANLRHAEIAARYGGEEFAVLLPGTTLSEAVRAAHRFRARIDELQLDVSGRALSIRVQAKTSAPSPTSLEAPHSPVITWMTDSPPLPDSLKITASFGVAAFPSSEISDVNGLLRCADRALYQAKAAGRNCVMPSEG